MNASAPDERLQRVCFEVDADERAALSALCERFNRGDAKRISNAFDDGHEARHMMAGLQKLRKALRF